MCVSWIYSLVLFSYWYSHLMLWTLSIEKKEFISLLKCWNTSIFEFNANNRHDLIVDCDWIHHFPNRRYHCHCRCHRHCHHLVRIVGCWVVVDTVEIDFAGSVVGNSTVDFADDTVDSVDYRGSNSYWNCFDIDYFADNCCCYHDSDFVH